MSTVKLFANSNKSLNHIVDSKTVHNNNNDNNNKHLDTDNTDLVNNQHETEQQSIHINHDDIQEIKQLFISIPSTITSILPQFDSINDKINNLSTYDKQYRFTYYDLKIYIMLLYNILIILWCKTRLYNKQGNDQTLSQIKHITKLLTYYKYLYERNKSINKKLHSTVVKILSYNNNNKNSKQSNNTNNDLRPNTTLLLNSVQNNKTDNNKQQQAATSQDQTDKNDNDKYVPRKLTAVTFNESKQDDDDNNNHRRRSRVYENEYLQDILNDEQPEQIQLNNNTMHDRVNDYDRAVTEFEEDNFVRLTSTKQSKKAARAEQRKMNDILYFQDNFNDLYNTLNSSNNNKTQRNKHSDIDIMNDESMSENKKKRMLSKQGKSYDDEFNKKLMKKQNNRHKRFKKR